MGEKERVSASSGGVGAAIAVMLLLVSWCYYMEIYGAVLAAVYGMAVAELYNRTSTGRKFRAWLRGEKLS